MALSVAVLFSRLLDINIGTIYLMKLCTNPFHIQKLLNEVVWAFTAVLTELPQVLCLAQQSDILDTAGVCYRKCCSRRLAELKMKPEGCLFGLFVCRFSLMEKLLLSYSRKKKTVVTMRSALCGQTISSGEVI